MTSTDTNSMRWLLFSFHGRIGRRTWWLWGAAHIYFLVSMRNRVIVKTQWLWSYLKFERGARLITGLKPR